MIKTRPITGLNITTKAGVYYAEFGRREGSIRKYRVMNWKRINQLDSLLKKYCDVAEVNLLPCGRVSVWYNVKPTGKPIVAQPAVNPMIEEREYIVGLFEKSSRMSNTNPLRAMTLYERSKQLEEAWSQKYEEYHSIMPDSFYLDVVPLIYSRAAARQAGIDREVRR